MKVVSGLELSASFICQNPEFASRLVKYFAPASFPKVRSRREEGDSHAEHTH